MWRNVFLQVFSINPAKAAKLFGEAHCGLYRRVAIADLWWKRESKSNKLADQFHELGHVIRMKLGKVKRGTKVKIITV